MDAIGRVAIIGCGTMGEAMLRGILRQKLVEPSQLIVSVPRAERRAELEERHGIQAVAGNIEAVTGAQIVVLAVKPQTMLTVLEEIKDRVAPDALVLSIAAGVRMTLIEQFVGERSVVRSMPNTPGSIGAGVTVWMGSSHCDARHKEWAQRVLTALGTAIEVDNEKFIDMATAVSGTGPGIVFYMMEAMVDAGVRAGLPRHLATRLVLETFHGSAEYARSNGKHLASLCDDVTSPGGTTAQAIHELDDAGVRPALSEAIRVAHKRCIEIAEELASLAAALAKLAKSKK